MYPVRLGFSEAKNRIRALLKNGHHAEAFLTAMFTVEKTFYRTLRQLIISAGFPSEQTDTLMGKFRGIENMKGVWACFDPKNESLSSFLSQKILKTVMDAQKMRNDLVHGKAVFKKTVCKDTAEDLLAALDTIRQSLNKRYAFDGWSQIKIRTKNALHADPRVKT